MVLFTSSNFFSRRVLFSRFFEENNNSLILETNYAWTGIENKYIISYDDEYHKIQLLQNIGIDSWEIVATHIGGPKLIMILHILFHHDLK